MRVRTNTAEVKSRCSAALTRIFNRVHSREAPDWVDTSSSEFQRMMHFTEVCTPIVQFKGPGVFSSQFATHYLAFFPTIVLPPLRGFTV